MKKTIKFCSVLFGTLLIFSLPVAAQIGIASAEAAVKPTLMVLGSYHFANPGKDVIKAKVTDVSTPDRQREIIQMIKRLEKYRPTKIVLECDIETSVPVQERFAQYLAGDYQLSVNEREQLGFRLAKNLKDKKIYCVDTNTDSPGVPADYNYFEYAARHPELDALLKSTQQKLQAAYDRRNERFVKWSIIKQFADLNDSVQIENDHAGYFYLLRLGEGTEYVGANWLASWYNRNFKILANIIRIVDAPQDRILAIYGAGHLKLLNQIAAESRYFKVESPAKYLKK